MATIGLRDVHYAILTRDDATGVAYETPVRIAGAISANVNPNTSSATLFADDGPYDSATTMGEIELELNMADIPAAVQAALLGHTYAQGMVVKKASDQPPYVAIAYRSLKSNGAYRYTWLYKGKFADGEENNQTKGDSIEWQTPTITGSFLKRDFDDAWQNSADSDDPNANSATIANWFNSVVNPPAGTGGLSVSPASATLAVGGTVQLTATGATAPTWTSSNTDVATVSGSGATATVTAAAAGTAYITCTNGTDSAAVAIVVH